MQPWCVLAVCLLVVVSAVDARPKSGAREGKHVGRPRVLRYSWLRNLQDGGGDFTENAYRFTSKDELWIRSYIQDSNNNQLRSAMAYSYPPQYHGTGTLTIRLDSVCLVHDINKDLSFASMVTEAETRNSTQVTVTSTDDVIVLRATTPDCDLGLVNPAVAMMCDDQVVPFYTDVLDAEPMTLENDEVKTTVTTFNGKAILIHPRQPGTVCSTRSRTPRSPGRPRCNPRRRRCGVGRGSSRRGTGRFRRSPQPRRCNPRNPRCRRRNASRASSRRGHGRPRRSPQPRPRCNPRNPRCRRRGYNRAAGRRGQGRPRS